MMYKTSKDIELEKVVDMLDEAGDVLRAKGMDYGRISESLHYINLDNKLAIEVREAAKQFLVFMPFKDLPEELLPVVQAAEKVGYHVKYTTVEAEHPRKI